LSMREISEKLNVSFATVQRHLHKEKIDIKKRGNPILIKNKHYKELTLEKSYIMGVIGPGDGFIEYNQNNGQYRVALEAVDLDFIDYFIFCLDKVYNIKPKIKELKIRSFGINKTFRVRLGSKQVCDDLLNYKANFKESNWTIPQAIKNSSLIIKAKYIQGFADSQGCVANYNTQRSIILSSNNISGLKEMAKLIKDFGIESTLFKHGLRITSQDNLEKFSNFINFYQNICYLKIQILKILILKFWISYKFFYSFIV